MVRRHVVVIESGVPVDDPRPAVIYRASRPDASDLTPISYEAHPQPVSGTALVQAIWSMFQALWSSNSRVIVAEVPDTDVTVSVPAALVEDHLL